MPTAEFTQLNNYNVAQLQFALKDTYDNVLL